ncbi:MAG: response regulator transcription factor [Bacteroidales bacterium]|nr:response regulator transcription factor [Bacteroidales bacterium]
MDKISIGIYDEHKLVQQGISSLLADVEDIEIVLKADEKAKLVESLKAINVNILIINVHILNTIVLNLLSQLSISFPRVRILVLSVHNDEEFILKIIRSGAKGFLDKDTDRRELIEAIYTIRSGYDFYSKSITHLLVNKYITKLKSEDGDFSANIKNLSLREIEILKLWGKSHSNKEIADRLFISVRTVESHKNHIMQKLNLKTIVDLVKFAIKNNLIEI